MSKMELNSGVDVGNTDECLLENRVSKNGASKAKFKVLKRMEIEVTIIYGIANFWIGFAKDNNRKYVFIDNKSTL